MQQNPLSKVVSLCNQPFPDIRNASLALLEAVASQKWGLVCLNSSPGKMSPTAERIVEDTYTCSDTCGGA
jgi:hypothetical protein